MGTQCIATASANEAEALSSLRTTGWAVFPKISTPHGLEECIRRYAESLEEVRPGRDPDMVFYNAAKSKEWLRPALKDDVNDGPIMAFVEGIEKRIRSVLLNETFERELVGIRRNTNVIPEGFAPHFDKRQYLTVLMSFAAESPDALGTVVYPHSSGRGFEYVRLPAGVAVVITGDQRQAATGIPATIHSAPRKSLVGLSSRRCVFIATYRSIDQAVSPDMLKELEARVQIAARFAADASFE